MIKRKLLLFAVVIVIILQSCFKGHIANQENQEEEENQSTPCPGLITVEHYGKVYNTVQIGNQCWLKENLDIGTMIPSNQDQMNNGIIEKFCYDNDITNCDKYGGLYQWDELMQYSIGEKTQGLCPSGFHIPTDDEFKELEGYLDGSFGQGDPEWDQWQWRGFDAGGKLKATGLEHWMGPNEGASNSSGFSALPHCYREWDAASNPAGAQFSGFTAYLCMWSSSENDDNTARRRALSYYFSKVYRSNHAKNFGYSARCIKD